LRPLIFFPPVVAPQPAGLGGPDALGVDDPGGGLRVPARQGAHPPPQRGVDPLPGPVAPPGVEVVAHRGPLREVVGQVPPGAAVPIHVEERVEHLAQVRPPRPAQPRGRRQQRRQYPPLRVGQIRRVRLAPRHFSHLPSTSVPLPSITD
jgi:hypothetical protein